MTHLQGLQQKTVLVVEDEASDRFPLERAFHQFDSEFSLQVVETGQAAVAYLEGRKPFSDRAQFPLPDLVVLDLRLPGMSGLDLLKWIREQSQFKDLPIITLTAYGNRDLPRAYELGINFYLLKPAEAHSLAEILQAMGLR
jgi:CheY-like chemotaxis protein